MDIVAADVKYAGVINGIIGDECCSEKLKTLILPGHSDWIYIAFRCLCGCWWKVWRTEIDSVEN